VAGLACGGGSEGEPTPSPEVRPAPGPQAVFPLRVAATGRFLEDAQGTPFLVHGEAVWSLTHNLTYDEALRYLEDRRARGVNTLVVSVPDAYGQDKVANMPPDRQGNQPFQGNDLARPNEAYWGHVDRVLATTEEMGFLVLFFPAYLGCCDDGYVDLLLANGVSKAQAYGRFVGERYGSRRNLIWVHGGDRDPGAAASLVVAVRDGIRSVGGPQLHAVHWAPETDPYGPFGEDFTDLYTTYTYGPVAGRVASYYQHAPVKPVLLLESHYENDFGGRDAADVRRYPYRALLSGASGHVFGNKPLWYCGYGWEAALDSEGSRSMEHVARLFRSRPWPLLVPDFAGELVVSGRGDPAGDSGVQAARADDGSFAFLFVPDRRTVRVNLRAVSGTSVRASWFDIATGTVSDAGTFPPDADRDFAPPVSGGAVLVLDDQARGFPLPATSLASDPPAAR
jgi:Protein of unknown function (DUF4038)/Putative collagen-binding domain of a collagenase